MGRRRLLSGSQGPFWAPHGSLRQEDTSGLFPDSSGKDGEGQGWGLLDRVGGQAPHSPLLCLHPSPQACWRFLSGQDTFSLLLGCSAQGESWCLPEDLTHVKRQFIPGAPPVPKPRRAHPVFLESAAGHAVQSCPSTYHSQNYKKTGKAASPGEAQARRD